jgi:hypothetical protein
MPSSARKPEYSLFVEFPDLSAPAKKRAGCAFGHAERTGNTRNGQAFLKAERRQSELHKYLNAACDARCEASSQLLT